MNNKAPLTCYIDCFSGISGDMLLAALLHCGLPENVLREELAKLKLDGFSLNVSPKKVNGIAALKVDISSETNQQFRHLSSIIDILENSELDEKIIREAIEIFTILGQAEAKVHDIDIEHVHFHEVGAIDTIIDIVGVCIGLHYLNISTLYSAPVPSPRGFVYCDHGTLPLPAPATIEILQGVPCYGVELQDELVTPTGAALLKVLVKDFCPLPPMAIQKTGYGAGTKTLVDNHPNLLRLILGQTEDVTELQQVEIIETNLDDWSPEGFQHLCDLLLKRGALDVNLTPIQMKKGRPAFKLQILCPPHLSLDLRNLLFCETTTIGVRIRREKRHTLPRKQVTVTTQWGEVKAKEVITPEGPRIYPEYEECKRVALAENISIQRVYDSIKKVSSS